MHLLRGYAFTVVKLAGPPMAIAYCFCSLLGVCCVLSTLLVRVCLRYELAHKLLFHSHMHNAHTQNLTKSLFISKAFLWSAHSCTFVELTACNRARMDTRDPGGRCVCVNVLCVCM